MTGELSRRTFLKGVTGVAGAVMLGGCNPSPPRPPAGARPTLRVVEWTGLGFPSPFTFIAGPGYWRMSLMFDTLTWPDSTGAQLPWLASSYRRSEDGLVYSVDLRNVSWKDGAPLTARDVAFTYTYYTSKLFTPLLIGVPRKDVEVVPTGDRSVEFRLPRPDATFLQQTLGTMPIVPEHVWSKISDPMAVSDRNLLMATGAYTLDSLDPAQNTESYVANDGFFLGRPFVQRIEMRPAENPLAALRIGELDGAASGPEGARNDVLAPFRDNPEFGLISHDAGSGAALFFNIGKGGALADLRFRRACLHAIDRREILERVLTGNGQVGSSGWLPPSHAYYDSAVRDYPFDRVEAGRLLDEAGYRRSGGGARTNPDGSPLRYKLYVADAGSPALPELIVAHLKEVGVEMDLEVIDLVRLFGLKTSGGYDMLISIYPGPTGVGPDGDPEIMRGVYHSAATNPLHRATGYANPQVDRLLDAQLATTEVEERKRLVRQVQRLVADDLPVAMLYYANQFFAYRKSVFDQWYHTPGGFGPGISDVYNKHVYITGQKTGLEVRR